MKKTTCPGTGRVLAMPTPDEDAAINAGIAQDPDTYEMGASENRQ